jgi:hypothetical protein
MPTFPFPDLPSQFRQLLGQCRDLYVSSGELAARDHAHLLKEPGERFVQLMDDLHRALVVKVFVSLCEADRRWSANEKFLAEVLLFHLWGQWLQGDQLQAALADMSEKAMTLKWYALIRPFDELAPLRDRISELETLVTRLANLIARADGPIKAVEAARIQSIQQELRVHLRAIPIDEPGDHDQTDRIGSQAIEKIFAERELLPALRKTSPEPAAPVADDKPALAASETPPAKSSAELLEEAYAELDRLIGLDNIKLEVRTLANFIKVQKRREEAGLPTAQLSLHMVFNGNPGTGKTTVARIVGKIFGAMGVLKKGHLIETDRSGMVAEYAGQTGPKTNKKVDEALDGVLFIDEAYTLIASEGEDPFGHEAVQTLLKRMEDQRDRLVVILAGYPLEMRTLLRSNPGLSSRFSRHLEFEDYTPLELAQIFGLMCGKSHYQLDGRARAKVMLGLTWLHERRDRHFGNGRTARNLFEHAIRRQANRIAVIENLSVEQLAALIAEDIEFEKCPADVFARLDDPQLKFHLECPNCKHGKDVPAAFLGQAVRCPKCSQDFTAQWGVLASESPSQADAPTAPASDAAPQAPPAEGA